ncbi:hypothetical protein BB560_002392 [Smittium megazygosporum]|uniref:Uncharacterized protein n=1 Tax=Smittium megazygosporum TaxID=133381 RepID=A0A2T9ZEX3_9FUNG|nr:hypothetical protein BB560_002392 [Smittium megazygosporum]
MKAHIIYFFIALFSGTSVATNSNSPAKELVKKNAEKRDTKDTLVNFKNREVVYEDSFLNGGSFIRRESVSRKELDARRAKSDSNSPPPKSSNKNSASPKPKPATAGKSSNKPTVLPAAAAKTSSSSASKTSSSSSAKTTSSYPSVSTIAPILSTTSSYPSVSTVAPVLSTTSSYPSVSTVAPVLSTTSSYPSVSTVAPVLSTTSAIEVAPTDTSSYLPVISTAPVLSSDLPTVDTVEEITSSAPPLTVPTVHIELTTELDFSDRFPTQTFQLPSNIAALYSSSSMGTTFVNDQPTMVSFFQTFLDSGNIGGAINPDESNPAPSQNEVNLALNTAEATIVSEIAQPSTESQIMVQAEGIIEDNLDTTEVLAADESSTYDTSIIDAVSEENLAP